MKTVTVQFLTDDGRIIWLTIPWGKGHLDYYRKVKKWTILMTV